MKSYLGIALLFAAVLVLTGTAGAESIKGKFGVTARGGFQVPADNEFITGTAVPAGSVTKIDSDTGFAAGGGFIFGLTNHLALEVDITYSQFDGKYQGFQVLELETTDISVGLQYRFNPFNKLVPYVGAGLDVLAPGAKPAGVLAGAGDLDVDTTVGGHLSAGADLFLTPQVALNAEFRGVAGAETDVNDSASGIAVAKFDPASFTGLFGVRFFFW